MTLAKQWRIKGAPPGRAPIRVSVLCFDTHFLFKTSCLGNQHPLLRGGRPEWEILDPPLLKVNCSTLTFDLVKSHVFKFLASYQLETNSEIIIILLKDLTLNHARGWNPRVMQQYPCARYELCTALSVDSEYH